MSNWTELDVWQYTRAEGVPGLSLHFTHRREVISRDGVLLAPHVPLRPDEDSSMRTVRFRTIGDATCTSAVESDAATVDDVVLEVSAAQMAERGGRGDDRRPQTGCRESQSFATAAYDACHPSARVHKCPG